MRTTIIGLAFLMLYTSSSFGTQLYKWTDENGQVHFSQTKPKHNESENLTIKDKERTTSLSKTQLIGEWHSDDEGKEVFILSENKFSIEKKRGIEYTHMSGTWELMNGRILLNITEGFIRKGTSFRNSERKNLKGVKLSALITHITAKELKILDSKGSTNYTKTQN
jgi:hypothetical protein